MNQMTTNLIARNASIISACQMFILSRLEIVTPYVWVNETIIDSDTDLSAQIRFIKHWWHTFHIQNMYSVVHIGTG